MLTEVHIRDRFVQCIDDLKRSETQKAIADVLGCSKQYMSNLKKRANPSVPAIYIAKFCVHYHYSPAYILTGKGEMKGTEPGSKEEKWEKERDKYLDLIGKLLEGILEFKGEWSDPLSKLINEAGKKINKQ